MSEEGKALLIVPPLSLVVRMGQLTFYSGICPRCDGTHLAIKAEGGEVMHLETILSPKEAEAFAHSLLNPEPINPKDLP